MFIEFQGALMSDTDTGKEYKPIGPIRIRMEDIKAYYSHTLMVGSNKVRVMETIEEIETKLKGK